MNKKERPKSGGVYTITPDGGLKKIEGILIDEVPNPSAEVVDINPPADAQDDEEEVED